MAISGWGIFLILLVCAAVLGAVGYVLYAHYRARQLGLPPPNFNPFSRSRNAGSYRAPAPAPGGIQGWIQDKWNGLRNKRTAGGAYEGTSYGGGRSRRSDRRAFGPLDPDEAWDARVDHEAGGYYEEQELGLQDAGQGPYGGGGYGQVGLSVDEGRGRSRSRQRELDARYDEEARTAAPRSNPFGDHAEPSGLGLGTVSPRPLEDVPAAASGHKKQKSTAGTTGSAEENSPTERRSMFHEEV